MNATSTILTSLRYSNIIKANFINENDCAYLMPYELLCHAGTLFSAIASVEVLCAVVASVLFNNVYSATVEWHPGFCFFVIAAVLIVPISLLL